MNNNQNGSKLYLFGITMVAILGGLLFGYDTAVISGAEGAMQQFFRQAVDFDYTNTLHGMTSSSALIGCVIGGAISGLLANRFGRRNSLMIASVLFFLSALGSFNPEFLFFEKGVPTFELFVAFNIYRVIGGIGVGLASAICPMYIAELAPASIRGTLVSCNQFAIIFGMLVVYFVNYTIKGALPNPEIMFGDTSISQAMVDTGWRRMFLSESIPAALFGLLLLAVPKTPRYLMMIGQESRALSVLERINGREAAAGIIEDIRATTREKQQPLLTFGVAVIVIGILLSIFQQAVGINVVLYYAPRIFESMGSSGDTAMVQTVVMGVVNILFTAVAIFTVDRWGRKPLLIVGSFGMMLGMIALGTLSFMGSIGVAALISIIIYTASFMMSWGPICWVLISEIFPNTIRGKAVAIAVAAQWIANYTVSSTFISLSEWSIGGTYLIYAAFGLMSIIFVWKFVPETKGKSLEDMTQLWSQRK
ncbi:MAG: D-xylose transporter XylE [Rikenellaceae bacterium]